MVSLSEAQQQVQQAREQIATQERIAEENRRILAEQKRRLPIETSQQSLRQKYSGLQGIQKRKTIGELREDISTKEKLLEQVKGELGSYSANVNKYEQNINAFREQQQALETVKKFSDKGDLAYLAMWGTGLEKEYASKALKQQDVEQQNWLRDVKKIQSELPEGEKLQIDISKMKITGIESTEFGKSMSLNEYNKQIESLQKSAGSINEKIGVAIPMLDVEDIQQVSGFEKLSTGTGMVSARGIETKEIQTSRNVISGKVDYTGEVYKPEKTIFQKVTGVVMAPVNYLRELSADVSAQRSAENVLGLGNVGSYGYVSPTTGEVINKDVWYGTPITKIPVAQQYQASQIQNKINSLSNELTNLQKGNIDSSGNWIGSESDYTKYQNKYNEYTNQIKKYESVGTKRNTSSFNINRPFATAVKVISKPVGSVAERITLKLDKGEVGKTKEYKYFKPVYGTQEYDIFGKPITKKDYGVFKETITEEDIKKRAKRIGEFAEVGAEIGVYLIPVVGTGMFIGTIGERLPEYKYNLIEFIKANPVESLALGGIAGFKVLKGTKNFAFGERLTYLDETLKPRIQNKAINKMSIQVNEAGEVVSRQFTGKAIGETLVKGRRTIVTNRFRDLFGMKPIYSGRYIEDVKGYKKALEGLTKKGYTENQAREMLRRYAPKREGQIVSYGGEILIGKGSPRVDITGMRYSGGLKENIILDYKGRKIVSPTRVGKPKEREVSDILEEYKTKTPKGKEEGDIGEVSFFIGKGEEFNPLENLGKRGKEFKEGAVAKKTSEEVFDLGKIETYKTGQVSKEITYKKPKVVSGSQTEVTIINPEVQVRNIYDLEAGLKIRKVKPIKKVGDLIVKAEDWITISSEQLPTRKIISNIVKPANIKKTPLSKTFGEEIKEKITIEAKKENVIGGNKKLELIKEPRILNKDIEFLASETSKLIKSDIKFAPKGKLIESNYPKMVGGTKEVENLLRGTTTFEEVSVTTKPTIIEKSFLDTQTKQESRFENLSLENIKLDLIQQPKSNLEFKQEMKFEQRMDSKLRNELKTNLKLESKQVQTQKTKQTQKSQLRQPTKPIKPKKPFIFKFPKGKTEKVSKKEEEEYSAIGIRFGKEIKLAKGSKEKVSKELTSFLKKGLGASGLITKGEEKLKAEETGLLSDIEFTKSKVNPYKIVERKEKRLRTGTTGKEVQVFRKTPRKSKSFF